MQLDRILLRGPNWLGDAVLAIPAMKAIRERFPQSEITLLVRPWVAGLFTGAGFVDHVWSEPRPRGILSWMRLAQKIRRRNFQAAVLFPNSFESAAGVFLGRVPCRLGYAADWRGWMLTHPVKRPMQKRHQVEYYLELAREFGDRDQFPARHGAVKHDGSVSAGNWSLSPNSAQRADARRLLASHGIPEGSAFMTLNPGAAYGSAKRWHPERFAETGDRLAARFGLRAAIIGSQSERSAAEEIRSRMRSPIAVLTGKTSLEVLIGVLAESALVITNDSGPMHIAAALGVPTVAVFGPTDERVTGPSSPRARVVKEPVPCSPCLLRHCPIDHRCMRRVTVEMVCKAAEEAMA